MASIHLHNLASVRPTTFFILNMSIIGGLQGFEQAKVMTNGGVRLYRNLRFLYLHKSIPRISVVIPLLCPWVLFILISIVTIINCANGKEQ